MKVVLGFFVCVFSLTILGSIVVNAVGWDTGVPELITSNVTAFSWTPRCATYYQTVEVEGVGQVPICVFGGDNPRVGITYADNGFVRLVISYPLDDKFSVLNGACEGVANCVYAPATDTLVSRYYSGPGLSARVYRHFSERIHRSLDPLTGEVRYTLDGSNPDFSFMNHEGQPLLVEALAVSTNGKWLALEYRDIGIMRINLDTFEMRRVWAQGFRYGLGYDPSIEMAISTDGSALAVMGERSGFSLTNITDSCGDILHVPMYGVFDSPDKSCPAVSVDVYSLITHFHGAYDPRFSEDGNRLYFTVMSQSGEARDVEIAKKGTTGVSRLQYLALGDSFTSGEGETDNLRYVWGTDDPFEKCHISARSYPFLFARLVGLTMAQSVACSGAKIRDISSFGDYWGQGSRLGSDGLRLSAASLRQVQLEALATFRSGRIPQDRFIEEYRPGIVTIGIGGNDAGLMTKLKVCLSPGICEWASDRHRTAEEIQALFVPLVGLYQQLLHLSPSTRFLAVGYPRLINPDGDCDPVTGLLLQRDERRFMSEALSYLNEVIRAAAYRAGIDYVDEKDAFRGHELCSGSPTPAMNGLRSGNDVNISSLLPFRLIGNESFHPTPFGHALMAEILRRSYEETQSGEGDIPPMPTYWGHKESKIRSIAEEFVSPTEITLDTPTLTISLQDNSLEPGSSIKIEIHSEPIIIEGLKANEKGGFQNTLSIPKDFETGFHMVHLFGTSYSGESIELYQEISYRGTEKLLDGPLVRNDPTEQAIETMNSFSLPGVLGQVSESRDNDQVENKKLHSSLDFLPLPKILIIGSICSALGILIFLLVRRFRAPADG